MKMKVHVTFRYDWSSKHGDAGETYEFDWEGENLEELFTFSRNFSNTYDKVCEKLDEQEEQANS